MNAALNFAGSGRLDLVFEFLFISIVQIECAMKLVPGGRDYDPERLWDSNNMGIVSRILLLQAETENAQDHD